MYVLRFWRSPYSAKCLIYSHRTHNALPDKTGSALCAAASCRRRNLLYLLQALQLVGDTLRMGCRAENGAALSGLSANALDIRHGRFWFAV